MPTSLNIERIIGNLKIHIKVSHLYCDSADYYYNTTSAFTHDAYIYNGSDSLVIKNDICGLFRLYWWQEGANIYITDSLYSFMNQEQMNQLTIDDNEYAFYKKCRCTSGDCTYFQQIKKIAPASTLKIDESGWSINTSYDLFRIYNEPDYKKYASSIFEAVKLSIKKLRSFDGRIILCYSGGVDSHYLSVVMTKEDIPFELVYFDNNLIGKSGLIKAQRGAEKLGKELYVINTPDGPTDDMREIIHREMMFDAHESIIHYYGIKGIVEKWGNNVVIVNGQNSDAILSYGPSETKSTSMMKRYLLYGHNNLLKYIFAFIIGIAFKRKFKIPKTDIEQELAFYNNFKYCLFIDKAESQLNKHIISKLTKINEDSLLRKINNLWMYIKCHTYIQGADSCVVVQSANHFNVRVLMPFACKEIIACVLRYKDNKIELFKPKYPLKCDIKKIINNGTK